MNTITSPTPRSALPAPRFFVVRWKSYPVFFHENPCGKVYSMVTEARATRFPDPDAAWRCAQTRHLQWADLEIAPAPANQPSTLNSPLQRACP